MEKENSKKGTKHIWWLTIVIIILLVATGLGGYLLGASKIANEVVKQKEEVIKEEEKGLELTDEIKAKLERFIKAASVEDSLTSSNYSTANYFNAGVTTISNKIKLKMAYNDQVRFGNIEDNHALTKQEVDDMETTMPKDDSGVQPGEPVAVIKTSDFDAVYKEFFKENPNYSLNDISDLGCPLPWGINKDLGKIYLFHRCGGSGAKEYKTEIASYEIDNENIVVKQNVEVYNPYEKKTEKTFVVIWKIDKELGFVSTSVE